MVSRPIGVIMDLSGPKIRLGDFSSPKRELTKGEDVLISNRAKDDSALPVFYPGLFKEVKSGQRIFIADGAIELVVTTVSKDSIRAKVIGGGFASPKKGVNLPDTSLSIRSLTEKDILDLRFGLELGVDWVALSFVRSASDIHSLRKIIAEHQKQTPIIAKIEKAEALKNIEEIVDAADAIMIARGDLGVETPLEEVPLAQKHIIGLANRARKPVIVATQMLESMVREKRPTRAEATDVANAVLDGADAVMLSEETAIGSYPTDAVIYMAKISEHAETELFSREHESKIEGYEKKGITNAVCHAAYHMAKDLNAAAIVTPTVSGVTPLSVSRYRPSQPIIALSDNIETLRRLGITFGITGKLVLFKKNLDDIIKTAREESLATGLVKKGDVIVITAGSHGGIPGRTNLIRVETL